MKMYKFQRKHISRIIFLTLLGFFIVGLQIGCKKDSPATSTPKPGIPLPAAMLVPDDDETEYTMEDYEEALDDAVMDDNGRLVFNNLSHFVTTAMALDSLGDSTANVWFQAMGFTNSLYNEYINVVNNMPPDADITEESQIEEYFAAHTNSVKYDVDKGIPRVNAIHGIIARLLNTDHKAVIGGNVYYSNYDVDVTVGAADEDLIQAYSTQGTEQDDENAIVSLNRVGLKTTGGVCVPAGWTYGLGDITCGSPIEKKSVLEMSVWTQKISGKMYTLAGIDVYNLKRGLFGGWPGQSRGSHVNGVFNGVHFEQKKIYGNSAVHHMYGVYKGVGSLNELCASSLGICVAPMCGGETLCKYW